MRRCFIRSWVPLQVLLVAFCVLAVTGAGRAQASGPLAALEQQRVLAARILAAQASGDLFTAALLYAQVADLEHVGPCNNSAPYVPPPAVMALCDGNLACLATNYVPHQPPGDTQQCAWLTA